MRSAATDPLQALQSALEEAAFNARAIGQDYQQRGAERRRLWELEQRVQSLEWLREQAHVYAQELARLYRRQREEARQRQEGLAALNGAYQGALRIFLAALELRGV